MNVAEAIAAGFDEAREHGGRTLLSLLGLTLGTASIISTLALFGGSNKRTQDFLAEVGGAATFIVRDDLGGKVRLSPREAASPRLTWRDVDDLLDEAPNLKFVSAARNWQLRYEGPRASFDGSVVATIPHYRAINDIEPQVGRYLTDLDVWRRNSVAVLGSSYADSLFGSAAAAVGQDVKIKGERFRVVGVLKREQFSFAAWEGNAFEYRNNRAYVPLTTALKRFGDNDKLDWLTLESTTPYTLPQAEAEVSAVLLRRHRVKDFSFDRSSSDAQEGLQFFYMFDAIFLLVGIICLFTGGIVITNILLASVVERIREIGTRMALGASSGDIFLHFLIQSMTITAVGGVAGALLGSALTSTVEKLMKFPAYVTPTVLIAGLGTALVTGLIAGIFPAVRAARLDPVEALTYG